MRKKRSSYHHGDLAESLLDAVDELATKFGLEAVTLRACAKLVGVSPSSAFRHYDDKRSLLTAFATRALRQLTDAMSNARATAEKKGEDAFTAVAVAYVNFAIERPAFFRAMWREESIYTANEDYKDAALKLSTILTGGFAETLKDHDATDLSCEELLAWSAVHGLANLLIDGPVGGDLSKKRQLDKAKEMISTLRPALESS